RLGHVPEPLRRMVPDVHLVFRIRDRVLERAEVALHVIDEGRIFRELACRLRPAAEEAGRVREDARDPTDRRQRCRQITHGAPVRSRMVRTVVQIGSVSMAISDTPIWSWYTDASAFSRTSGSVT